MKAPLHLFIAVALGLPRVAASYAAYVSGPLLAVRWVTQRALVTAVLLVGYLLLVLGLNAAIGLKVSPVAWLFELALLLPFLLATFGLPLARNFDGRKLIRILNVIVFVMSFVTLVRLGFPFQIPYVHYLPDAFDGGFGAGGAKTVTVIGFFGLLELFSGRRDKPIYQDYFLYIAGINFIIPNFILGIVAGVCGLAMFAPKNRSLILAGAVAAVAITPYIILRTETKNSSFAEYYKYDPKLYAYKLVGDIYLDQPQTALIGAGLGQYAGEAAIWASPINQVFGESRVGNIPYLTSSDVHLKHLAPTMLRFRDNVYAIESSSNKPYSGISVLLVEGGLIFTLLIVLLLYNRFWRHRLSYIGKACFVFFLAMNLLDNQLDSPWYGTLLFAVAEIVQREKRRATRRTSLRTKKLAGVGPAMLPGSPVLI
ncbi:hypothetical protein K3172_11175 [Qipengyuania sp. 6B39]|uniref:hypothetical protein n=1 Tax=Qipengyuania proteolytica TaxID=2867239 RepID=UPI001C89EE61|nr:hypothetical protein [Qipengyuania proteolytica]MBX7496415.1 hypothetical protein [Qipengyuania proteolytica]